MKRVSLGGRVLDLVGLLLLIAGAGLFVRAWIGFRNLPSYERDPGGDVFATVAMADGLRKLGGVGVASMLLGVGVFVVAWWVAGRGEDDDGDRPGTPSAGA